MARQLHPKLEISSYIPDLGCPVRGGRDQLGNIRAEAALQCVRRLVDLNHLQRAQIRAVELPDVTVAF